MIGKILIWNCFREKGIKSASRSLFLYIAGSGGSTLCSPQLQSTCPYIVNHYVKIWHVHLEGANNMQPLSWGGGGGGMNEKRAKKYFT